MSADSNSNPLPPVQNNENRSRFEMIFDDGGSAFLSYRRTNDVLDLMHTEVPRSFEGRGVAGALARTALDYARDHQLAVIPTCGFVAAYIQRHPEYQTLIHR